MINPIDKDKTAENPGLLPYPHHVGSIIIKPEDRGLIKSKALSAMYEQTDVQLGQIQQQVEVLLVQANEIKKRVEVSEKIYQAEVRFEPVVNKVYHLYEFEGAYKLMLIGPDEWGSSAKGGRLNYISSVKLLSDYTWQVINTQTSGNLVERGYVQ